MSPAVSWSCCCRLQMSSIGSFLRRRPPPRKGSTPKPPPPQSPRPQCPRPQRLPAQPTTAPQWQPRPSANARRPAPLPPRVPTLPTPTPARKARLRPTHKQRQGGALGHLVLLGCGGGPPCSPPAAAHAAALRAAARAAVASPRAGCAPRRSAWAGFGFAFSVVLSSFCWYLLGMCWLYLLGYQIVVLYFAGLSGFSPAASCHVVIRLPCCRFLRLPFLPCCCCCCPVCTALAACWWSRSRGLRPRRRCCRAFGGAVCAGVRRRFAAARRARGSLCCHGVGCGRCWGCAGRVSGCWAALPGGRSPWLRLLWWRFWLLGLVCVGCAVGRGCAGVVVRSAARLAGFRWAFARAGLVVSASGSCCAVAVCVGFYLFVEKLPEYQIIAASLYQLVSQSINQASQVMQVTSVFLDILTDRILPAGPCSLVPGVFHIEHLFGQHWRVQVSPTAVFQATELVGRVADEYEASQVVLESDFSTL